MTLYDLLVATQQGQKFFVYVTNTYDQNLLIGTGVRRQLLDEYENDECFFYLMDEVDQITIAKDGKSLVVKIKDENYLKNAKELYDEDYVKYWDNRNPETRPWRYSTELEDFKMDMED